MPLDAYDIGNEVEAPVSYEEATGHRLHLYRSLLQYLMPEFVSQLMAAEASLYSDHNLENALSPCLCPAARNPTADIGLDLLGGFESPPRFLKLRPCSFTPHSMDTGTCEPATTKPL
jgi:hypothetical protein